MANDTYTVDYGVSVARWANSVMVGIDAAGKIPMAKAPTLRSKCICCGSTDWTVHGGKEICSYCRNSP